jgi:hypothetical protein
MEPVQLPLRAVRRISCFKVLVMGIRCCVNPSMPMCSLAGSCAAVRQVGGVTSDERQGCSGRRGHSRGAASRRFDSLSLRSISTNYPCKVALSLFHSCAGDFIFQATLSPFLLVGTQSPRARRWVPAGAPCSPSSTYQRAARAACAFCRSPRRSVCPFLSRQRGSSTRSHSRRLFPREAPPFGLWPPAWPFPAGATTVRTTPLLAPTRATGATTALAGPRGVAALRRAGAPESPPPDRPSPSSRSCTRSTSCGP